MYVKSFQNSDKNHLLSFPSLFKCYIVVYTGKIEATFMK